MSARRSGPAGRRPLTDAEIARALPWYHHGPLVTHDRPPAVAVLGGGLGCVACGGPIHEWRGSDFVSSILVLGFCAPCELRYSRGEHAVGDAVIELVAGVYGRRDRFRRRAA